MSCVAGVWGPSGTRPLAAPGDRGQARTVLSAWIAAEGAVPVLARGEKRIDWQGSVSRVVRRSRRRLAAIRALRSRAGATSSDAQGRAPRRARRLESSAFPTPV